MKKMKLRKPNQKGQGVMEYVILTGLIGIFCLGMVKQFGGTLKKRIEQIDYRINHEVKIR